MGDSAQQTFWTQTAYNITVHSFTVCTYHHGKNKGNSRITQSEGDPIRKALFSYFQASCLFLELDPSGEALSPCRRFLGTTSAGEGEIAGADERLLGLGVPPSPPPLPPPLPPLSPFSGVLEGVWAFWRSASCRLCLSLSRVFM